MVTPPCLLIVLIALRTLDIPQVKEYLKALLGDFFTAQNKLREEIVPLRTED